MSCLAAPHGRRSLTHRKEANTAQDFSPNDADTAEATAETVSPLIPDEIKALLGKPPLLRGESAAEYDQLFHKIAIDMNPRDFSTWLLAQGATDNIWESRRQRRMKLALIDKGIPDAADSLLSTYGGNADFSQDQKERGTDFVARGMLRGEESDAKAIDKALHFAGLTRDALTAVSLVEQIDNIERIDHMISSNDRRRRDLARHDDRQHRATSDRPKQAIGTRDPADVVP